MSISFSQVATRSDLYKLLILFIVAMIAWSFVFENYSDFQLEGQLEREKYYEQQLELLRSLEEA